MINIKGVGVDLSFEDNIKKIIENGYKETILSHDEDTKQRLNSISKLFTHIKKFELNDTKIIITGKKWFNFNVSSLY